jgi:cell division protein FtsA
MKKQTKIITGIDVGTTKTKVLVGEANMETENINIIGYSEKPSEGIVKGGISDLIKASAVLNEAVQEAEQNSNAIISPEALFVSITGNHINSKEEAGTIIIDNEDKAITQLHVKEVLKITKNQFPPPDCILLDTIDGNFIIDDTYHVTDPVGQTGKKLEAHTHIIYADKNRVESFRNLIKDLGFESCVPVFSGTATALAVLTSDDFEHGTLVVNMGGGTTEYVLFNNYAAISSNVLSVGINHVLNDLYLGLEVDLPFARDIINNNLAGIRKRQGFNTIEKKGTLKARNIPISSIEKIIELRLRETFEVIHTKLQESGHLNLITNGIVLCGGISYFPEIQELVRSTFETPVRIGCPTDNISGHENVLNSPGFLTSIGLLRYGTHELQTRQNYGSSIINKLDQKLWSFWKKTWSTIINDTEK